MRFRNVSTNNVIAFFLALVSSFFLFISGTTGVNTWRKIEEIVLRYVDFVFIDFLFVLVLIIASLGGLSVFIGGILIIRNKVLLGNVFVALGAGAGFISFFFNLFISMVSFNFSLYSYLSYSSLGVFFALATQFFSTGEHRIEIYYKFKEWVNKLFNK
ncbi:MAG: hypothetical protein ACMXYG_03870 [Candidatus Woesearchaeota archaeon]